MKKVVFIIVALLGINGLQAQDIKSYKFDNHLKPKLGLTTGTGINWLANGLEESDPRLGFNIGTVFNVPLSRQISIEFESVFSKKGGQVFYQSNSWYAGKVKYNLYYFDFPVLVKCKLNPVISLTAGFQQGYLVDADVEYLDPYVYGFVELNESALDQWNSSVIGGVAFGGRNRSLELRFVYGLNSVANSTYGNYFLEDAQNIAFQICFKRYFGRR